MSFILAIDPGCSCLGYVVACAEGGSIVLEDWGAVRTAKSPSTKVTQAEDQARRIREQVRGLLKVLDHFDVALAVVEAPAGAKSAAAGAAIARAFALVVATLEARAVPVHLVYPWHVKAQLTGSRNGSKVDVARAVAATEGFSELALWLDGVPKSRAEHVWDAAACLVSALDAPLVRAVMQKADREFRLAKRNASLCGVER